MSYWDILTDDLKQHIINMRDNKIKNENKNNPDYQFKIGIWVLPPCKLEKYWIMNPHVKKFNDSIKTLALCIEITRINLNKLTIYIKDTKYCLKFPRLNYQKLYYPKISFDENNIPFIFIKNQMLNVNDKIYFKDLITFKPGITFNFYIKKNDY